MSTRIFLSRHGIAFLFALGLFALTAIAQAADSTLTVMTYNLRYASSTPPNAWPDRRPVMKECIESVSPDVFGTQEGLYHQLKDVAADLPAYDWIGTGRDGGSKGEFMAVFYRRERLEPLEFDHFWLSDTPNIIGSTTWGNSNRRMVTWVKFKDKQTGKQFYFWNTHFDHEIQPAREKSAALVRERVLALKTDLPVILVGDFNAKGGENPAYHTLVNAEAFKDSWFTAAKRVNEEYNSFTGFRPGPHKGGDRIDWILYRGNVSVSKTEIVLFQKNNQLPSDHFPVVSWVKLGE